MCPLIVNLPCHDQVILDVWKANRHLACTPFQDCQVQSKPEKHAKIKVKTSITQFGANNIYQKNRNNIFRVLFHNIRNTKYRMCGLY